MFRAMFSPIIKSTWLYLQYLEVFIQDAAGLDELKLLSIFNSSKTPAGSNLGEHYQIQ